MSDLQNQQVLFHSHYLLFFLPWNFLVKATSKQLNSRCSLGISFPIHQLWSILHQMLDKTLMTVRKAWHHYVHFKSLVMLHQADSMLSVWWHKEFWTIYNHFWLYLLCLSVKILSHLHYVWMDLNESRCLFCYQNALKTFWLFITNTFLQKTHPNFFYKDNIFFVCFMLYIIYPSSNCSLTV